jgi:hypothetical protein
MGVHIPKTGQQRLAGCVDYFRSRGWGDLIGRAHLYDAVAGNHYALLLENLP